MAVVCKQKDVLMFISVSSSRPVVHGGVGGDLQPDWLVLPLPGVLLHLPSARARVELPPGHADPRGLHRAADGIRGFR